jgi:thymidylate synthase ThyX
MVERSKPSARVITDSVSEAGDRLTTLEVTMHRLVLAEFNTHRVFSRNSASSRAIPIEKRLSQARHDPAMPVYWGRNQRGMQAAEELTLSERIAAEQVWLDARNAAIECVERLSGLEVHKQIANRLLEPFLWHTVVVTATEWDNFFAQRCSPLAQPEIRAAAEAMRAALDESMPRLVRDEEWHLPYVPIEELETMDFADTKRLSVARCARVSYLTHDGVRDLVKDYELYERLADATPPHASPFEHVARPLRKQEIPAPGNFRGWAQLRHEVGL